MKLNETEKRNPRSMNFDKMSTREMIELMNDENRRSVEAVEHALDSVEKAVDAIAEAFGRGNSLIYIGAGTSGRLGIQDAAECGPTFGVPEGTVKAIIAGGRERVFTPAENAEDVEENGRADILKECRPGDVVVGISAAGGARYVVGALNAAKKNGCFTVALTNNTGTAIEKEADVAIVCETGPEVITGSTRLKAGNSQKFVLNMLTTCAMAKTGKVCENLMINLKPSNDKLRARVIRITSDLLGITQEEAEEKLKKHSFSIRETVDAEK